MPMPIKHHDRETYSGMAFVALYFVALFILTISLIVVLALL